MMRDVDEDGDTENGDDDDDGFRGHDHDDDDGNDDYTKMMDDDDFDDNESDVLDDRGHDDVHGNVDELQRISRILELGPPPPAGLSQESRALRSTLELMMEMMMVAIANWDHDALIRTLSLKNIISHSALFPALNNNKCHQRI